MTGDNGILTKTTNAAKKNRESAAIEDVQMAWESTTLEYWKDWSKDTSKLISSYRTKEKLDTYLIGKGVLEDDPEFDNISKEYTIKYRSIEQNELYIFLITEDGKAKKKTGLILSPSKITMEKDEEMQLEAKFIEMKEETITYSSQDTSIVTVDANGKIKAIANGETTVRAKCRESGETSTTCKVTVATKLAKVANPGDYVDINVGYMDQMDSTKDYRTDNKSKAWRVYRIDSNTGIVKLISTGHPLKYTTSGGVTEEQHMNKVKTLENGSITIGYTSGDRCAFSSSGFTPEDMSGIFNNSEVFSGVTYPVWTGEIQTIPSNSTLYKSLIKTGQNYYIGSWSSFCPSEIRDSGQYGGSSGNTHGFRPVVILNPDVIVNGGIGNDSKPFTLKGIVY